MFYQPLLRPLMLMPEILPTDVVVFLALAFHLNNKRRCWPSVETLGFITHLSRRTVQRSLRKMEELKVIKTFPSHRRSSTYEIGEAMIPYLTKEGRQ